VEQAEVIVIDETWLRCRVSPILFLVSRGIVPWSVARRAINYILGVDILVSIA
jgi:hypothetical protein